MIRKSVSWKLEKFFFWENITNFFRVGLFKKKYKKFFRKKILGIRPKSALGTLSSTTHFM